MQFQGAGTPLTAGGLNGASAAAGVGLPEMWTVVSVETSGCGFLPDRRPKILFERHIFSRHTGGKFDADDPDVSQPSAGGYGPPGAHQYDRLAAAMLLDASAALQSASWGLGQVMGENATVAGFLNVDAMVTQMSASEDAQVLAMANFIRGNRLNQPLASHDWASFARSYNGANYAANDYDGRLQQAFARYANGSTPDLTIRTAQVYLGYLGYSTGGVDGLAGTNTTAAVRSFQAKAGLAQTGTIDAALIAALAAAVQALIGASP